MRKNHNHLIEARIAKLRSRIEVWRQTRKPGRAMPAELWAAAVELARTMGIGPTARALRVDFGALRNRIAESAPPPPAPVRDQRFIEWTGPRPSASGVVIECEAPSRGRMTIRLDNVESSNIVTLVGLLLDKPDFSSSGGR